MLGSCIAYSHAYLQYMHVNVRVCYFIKFEFRCICMRSRFMITRACSMYAYCARGYMHMHASRLSRSISRAHVHDHACIHVYSNVHVVMGHGSDTGDACVSTSARASGVRNIPPPYCNTWHASSWNTGGVGGTGTDSCSKGSTRSFTVHVRRLRLPVMT